MTLRLTMLFLITYCVMQSQIRFERTFGAWSQENGYGVVQTYDSGYVVVGSSSSYGNGTTELYLLKIDSLGIFQWHKFFGDVNVDAGLSIVETADSGLVCVGHTNSFGNGGYDVWIFKADRNGNQLWSKTVGGADWDFGTSVKETSDGGLIITGSTYSYGNGDRDIYVIRTDSNGDTLWTKAYGGADADEGDEIMEVGGGSFVLTGKTKSFGSGGYDVITMKLGPSGDTLANTGWHRIFGGSADDVGGSLTLAANGEYMIGAFTESMGNGSADALYLRYDSSGSLVFFLPNGSANYENVHSIILHPDGGFLFVGQKNTSPGGQFNIHLEKNLPTGWFHWARDYGGLADEDPFQVIECYDRGYLIVSNTRSYGNGMTDIYLIKTDTFGISSGTVIVGLEEKPEHNFMPVVFPSIFKESFSVAGFGKFDVLHAEYALFDVSGRKVSFSLQKNGSTVTIRPDNGCGGILFLRIIADGKMSVVKVVSL